MVNLLNRKAWTVNELSKELNISRNSVHQQMMKLEANGIVQKFPRAPTGVAGKPAFEYRTVAGREDTGSTAYKPLLQVLLQTINEKLSAKEKRNLLVQAGKNMSDASGCTPSGDLKADIETSLAAVNSLGAQAELVEEDGIKKVQCFSCPIASLVHAEPMACQLVAAFFSRSTGRQVTIQCEHRETVVCGFRFEAE